MRRRGRNELLRRVEDGTPGPTALPPDVGLSRTSAAMAEPQQLDGVRVEEVAPEAHRGPAPVPTIGHTISRPATASAALVPPPPAGPPVDSRPTAPEEAAAEPETPQPRHGAAGLVQREPDPSVAPGGASPPPAQPADTKSATGTGSTTTITVKPTTRAISAANLTALWAALTRSGTKEAASVQPKLTPAPQYEYDESDTVTKVVVTVIENKEMPQWTEADVQCPPIKAEWSRFYHVLDAHEDRHLAIDQKHFANVHTKLLGKKKEDAWLALDAVVDAADKANEAYDQQSGHGVNEGANINTAVQCAPEKVPSSTSREPELLPLPDPVAPVLQAKLEVNQPGDPMEEEADRVADRVVRGEDSEQHPAGSSPAGVQRRCAAPGTCDCERCRAARTGGDVEPVVRGVVGAGRGMPLDPETRDLMESRIGHDFSQVRVHTGAEAARSAANLQAQAYTVGSDVVFGAGKYAPGASDGRRLIAHELTHVVQQGRGGGHPLSPEVRGPMEARFGHDFGAVRVHTDGAAAAATSRLDAKALAIGHHLAFAPGQFAPDSLAGRQLLAHELTHVVQAGRGPSPGRFVSKPGDPAEREATDLGAAALVGPVQSVQPAGAIVHRDPKSAPPTAAPSGGAPKPPPLAGGAMKFDDGDISVLQLRATILDGIKESVLAENKFVGDVFGIRVELTKEELEPGREKVRAACRAKFPDIKRRALRAWTDYKAEYNYRANMPFTDRALWDLAHTNFFGGSTGQSPNPLHRDPGDKIEEIVDNVEGHLKKVDDLLKTNYYMKAAQYLESAEKDSYKASWPLYHWKEQDLKGAENTIAQLEAIKFASDVALVALGGLGGLSMAKTVGTISMGQAIATQGLLIAAKYAAGDKIDWKKEGVTGLVTVILAKFSGVLSNSLAKKLAGSGAVTLGEDMSNKIIAALIVHEGSVVLQTSVDFVYRNNFEAGKKPATWQEFFDALLIRMTDPKGLVLSVLGAAIQSASDFKPGAAPRPSTTDPTTKDAVRERTGTILSKGGPESIGLAKSVITEEKNFYGVRILASERGSWGAAAQSPLEQARQQIIDKVVVDLKAKYPNTTIEKSGGGFVNPYVVKVRSKGAPPGPGSPAPASPMATTGPGPAGGGGAGTGPTTAPAGTGATTGAPGAPDSALKQAWQREAEAAWADLGEHLEGVPFRPWAPLAYAKSLDARAWLELVPDLEGVTPYSAGQYAGMAAKLDEGRFELVRKFGGQGTPDHEGTSEKWILKDKESGQEFLFKPQSGDPKNLVHEMHGVMPGSFMSRARAAYGVGLQMPSATAGAPSVNIVEYKGQYGSLQPWIKGTRSLNQLHSEDPQLATEVVRSPEFKKYKAALDAYDYVINSVDRNPGNVLVKFGPDGKKVEGFLAIDQDISLTPGMRIVGGGAKAMGAPAKISRATYNELLGMKANEAAIKDGLTLTLNPELKGDRSAKIDGIFERLDTMLKGYDAKQKKEGQDSIFLD